MDFGSAKSPQCDGIPFDRLAEVDWSKINKVNTQKGQLEVQPFLSL
jgi:hypothetical protein